MEISEPREIWDEISGLAICAGSRAARGYLFVALTNSFAIYLARTFTLLGTEVLSEELKLGHIATYRPTVLLPTQSNSISEESLA